MKEACEGDLKVREKDRKYTNGVFPPYLTVALSYFLVYLTMLSQLKKRVNLFL
jgi:hypothetical protein